MENIVNKLYIYLSLLYIKIYHVTYHDKNNNSNMVALYFADMSNYMFYVTK